MQALTDIAIAFAAFVGMALLGLLGFAGWKYYSVLRDVRKQLTALNSNLSGVPVILNGIKSICVELSSNTLNMSNSALALKQSLLTEETSDPRRPGFMPYDTDKANAAYEAHRVAEAEAVTDMQGDTFFVE